MAQHGPCIPTISFYHASTDSDAPVVFDDGFDFFKILFVHQCKYSKNKSKPNPPFVTKFNSNIIASFNSSTRLLHLLYNYIDTRLEQTKTENVTCCTKSAKGGSWIFRTFKKTAPVSWIQRIHRQSSSIYVIVVGVANIIHLFSYHSLRFYGVQFSLFFSFLHGHHWCLGRQIDPRTIPEHLHHHL